MTIHHLLTAAWGYIWQWVNGESPPHVCSAQKVIKSGNLGSILIFRRKITQIIYHTRSNGIKESVSVLSFLCKYIPISSGHDNAPYMCVAAPFGLHANWRIKAETKWMSFHRWHLQSIFFNQNVWSLVKNAMEIVPKGPINNISALALCAEHPWVRWISHIQG